MDSNSSSPDSSGWVLVLFLGVGFAFLYAIIHYCISNNSHLPITTPTPTLSPTPTPTPASLSPRVSGSDEESMHVAVVQHNGVDARTISIFPRCTYAELKLCQQFPSACAVCLDDYSDSEMLRLLPECGHVFHRNCIDSWLFRHRTCPICRTEY